MRNFIATQVLSFDSHSLSHESIATHFAALFAQWSRRGHGGVAFAFGSIGTTPHVRFYRQGNDPRLDSLEAFSRWRPDLVIEIAPDEDALERHAADGIPEVWLVDPVSRSLERHVLDESLGGYAATEAAYGGAVFRPSGFEGLSVELSKLWAASDAVTS